MNKNLPWGGSRRLGSPPTARFWGALVCAALALVCLLWPSPAFAGGPSEFKLDCAKLNCGGVLPGAKKFAFVDNAAYQVGTDAEGEIVGWVVLSTDVTDIKGYSGKPLVTLVGLTPEGLISGARVVHHSEPILLVGIPEKALTDFVAFYTGKKATAQVVVGSSRDPEALTVDMVSGATVTVLAENRTILDTARGLGSAVGVVKLADKVPGHFVNSDTPWTWAQMIKRKVFGRLTVTDTEMGLEGATGNFIDLYFTIINSPQVGRAILGDTEYKWMMGELQPDEYLLVILGNGSNSFKGSGFVRGGMFDRVFIEQGLRSTMFRDTDYKNLSGVEAEGAPSFKEGAVFTLRKGRLDPGMPFDLIFTGSRYNQQGGFSRDFRAVRATYELPPEMYYAERPATANELIWRAAWTNHRRTSVVVALYLLLIVGLFAGRRWLTKSMKWLKIVHTVILLCSFLGLGLWLRAQPSVTQVLTLVGSTTGEWRWGLFLTEPLLFISWIFIALVTLLWGRGVFCGWVCPYGALSELLFKLGRWLKVPEYELPDRVHRPLRYLRYLVLAGLVASYLYSAEMGERLAEIEPFKTTFFVAPWKREGLYLGWWAVLLVLSLGWWRPFCRYLCPLGAALAIPGSLRLSEPYRRSFCEKCTICTKTCEPRAIGPDGSIDPRECLNCMECESNFGDQAVCPPLVGIERLTAKRDGQAFTKADQERMERLERDGRATSRFAPALKRATSSTSK